MPGSPDGPRRPNLKQGFQRSVGRSEPNFGFVALAIGRWLAHSRDFARCPKWALDACLSLHERSEQTSRSLIEPSLGPSRSEADDQNLQLMADIFINLQVRRAHGIAGRLSVRKIARYVLRKDRCDDDDADVQRLQRLWRHEGDVLRAQAITRLHEKLRKQGLLAAQE